MSRDIQPDATNHASGIKNRPSRHRAARQKGNSMGFKRRRTGVLLSLALMIGTGAASGAAPAAAEEMTVDQARTKLLGAGWNQAGKVRARSIGNTTWLVSYGPTVVLYDSTIEDQLTDTGEDADHNGHVSLDDILAARPDVIFQHHTHADQNRHLAEIATKTGVPVVADIGGCAMTKMTAIEEGFDPAKVNCNILRDSEGKAFFTPDTWAIPVGQSVDLGLGDLLEELGLNLGLDLYGQEATLGDFLDFTDYGTEGWPTTPVKNGLEVKAVMVKHSPTFFNRPWPENMSGSNLDPDTAAKELLNDYGDASPEEIAENLLAFYKPFDAEGSNVGYLVNYQDFSLFTHGSTGPTNNLEPGAAKVAQALTRLSPDDRIDVEIGSLAEQVLHWENGQYFEDQKQYAQRIGAKQYFPTHHYNWYPAWLTNPAAAYYPGMVQTWADGHREYRDHFPTMCYLTEDNYATLFEFRTANWKGDNRDDIRTVTGPGCYTG